MPARRWRLRNAPAAACRAADLLKGRQPCATWRLRMAILQTRGGGCGFARPFAVRHGARNPLHRDSGIALGDPAPDGHSLPCAAYAPRENPGTLRRAFIKAQVRDLLVARRLSCAGPGCSPARRQARCSGDGSAAPSRTIGGVIGSHDRRRTERALLLTIPDHGRPSGDLKKPEAGSEWPLPLL